MRFKSMIPVMVFLAMIAVVAVNPVSAGVDGNSVDTVSTTMDVNSEDVVLERKGVRRDRGRGDGRDVDRRRDRGRGDEFQRDNRRDWGRNYEDMTKEEINERRNVDRGDEGYAPERGRMVELNDEDDQMVVMERGQSVEVMVDGTPVTISTFAVSRETGDVVLQVQRDGVEDESSENDNNVEDEDSQEDESVDEIRRDRGRGSGDSSVDRRRDRGRGSDRGNDGRRSRGR